MTYTWTVLVFKGLAVVGFAGLVARVWLCAATVQPAPPARLGLRGHKRALALRGPCFRHVEPLLRYFAAVVAKLPLNGARRRIERRLVQSGYYLGMQPDEFLGLSLLVALLGGALGLLAGASTGARLGGPVPCMTVGLCLGYILASDQLSKERDRRHRAVSRGLPAEIDLLAMCMNAGMDMPSGLSTLIKQSQAADALVEEFSLIVQELELGRTRAAALHHFAERVPTEPVREFVAALVQAEQKGTPLAEVLRIQASMLRMRRSVLAEEAASRASVLLIIPLMMMMGCVLIVVLGPMLLEATRAEFFS